MCFVSHYAVRCCEVFVKVLHAHEMCDFTVHLKALSVSDCISDYAAAFFPGLSVQILPPIAVTPTAGCSTIIKVRTRY